MDPSGKLADFDIKYLLVKAGLAHLLERSCTKTNESNNESQESDPLNFEIEEGGSNLSTGEKQLICIVRAILRKN